MKSPTIYSGLTDEQAFALMNAMYEARQLKGLEVFCEPRRYWVTAGSLGVVLAVAVAVALASVQSGVELDHIGLFVCGAFALWSTVAYLILAQTKKRVEYLRNLQSGLKQLKSVAEASPGATAAELLKAMPD